MEPHAPTQVVIPLAKDKIIACLIGSIAFFFIGIWMLATADSWTGHDPLEMKVISILCISLFGLGAVYFCVKVFDRQPGLIIDNSSGVAVGRIFWADVVALEETKVRGMHNLRAQRFITIFVADPAKYARQVNIFGRMLNAGSALMTGSSINISPNTLEMSFDHLFYELNAAFRKYQASRENDLRATTPEAIGDGN